MMAIHTQPDDKVKMYCLQEEKGDRPRFSLDFSFVSTVKKKTGSVPFFVLEVVVLVSHCRCNRYGDAGLYAILYRCGGF